MIIKDRFGFMRTETAEQESLRKAGVNLDTHEKRKDYMDRVKRFEKFMEKEVCE